MPEHAGGVFDELDDPSLKSEPLFLSKGFSERCPGVAEYEAQWSRIPEGNAFAVFNSSVERLPSDKLPFMYLSLKKVYPEVADKVKAEWPTIEQVIAEMGYSDI